MGTKKRNWIQGAIKKPGAFRAWCRRHGFEGATEGCIEAGLKSKDPKVRKRAQLAKTLKRLRKRRKKK